MCICKKKSNYYQKQKGVSLFLWDLYTIFKSDSSLHKVYLSVKVWIIFFFFIFKEWYYWRRILVGGLYNQEKYTNQDKNVKQKKSAEISLCCMFFRNNIYHDLYNILLQCFKRRDILYNQWCNLKFWAGGLLAECPIPHMAA